MSTTEYIIVTSTGPKYRLVSPEAAVETISFGTPIGSRCIACVASAVPPVPPSAPIASKPALGMEPQHDLRRAAGHRLDRRAPVARVRERLDVRACRGRHLLAGHVGLGERLAEDARVDQQHIHPALADAVAEVGVLLALRVQRPDQEDRRAPLRRSPRQACHRKLGSAFGSPADVEFRRPLPTVGPTQAARSGRERRRRK